eukprot:1148881-Pelagomonas_calceolata.AAC.4
MKQHGDPEARLNYHRQGTKSVRINRRAAQRPGATAGTAGVLRAKGKWAQRPRSEEGLTQLRHDIKVAQRPGGTAGTAQQHNIKVAQRP